MSVDNIAKLLSGGEFSLERLVRYRDTVATFFGAFPGLEKYKRSTEEELERSGSIASLMGNRRVRSSAGPLTPKERRWALSQRIQGTASLIFKRALLGLAERFGKESIVLPMHDAVLMQYDEPQHLAAANEASEIMAAAFQEWCPNVKPRISLGEFASGG